MGGLMCPVGDQDSVLSLEVHTVLGFAMGTGKPMVFPKQVLWVWVWVWTLAHHGIL